MKLYLIGHSGVDFSSDACILAENEDQARELFYDYLKEYYPYISITSIKEISLDKAQIVTIDYGAYS